MNKRIKHMFDLAREESRLADYCGYSDVKIGCVVALNGTIIAKGHNTNRTSTIQDRYNHLRFDNSAANKYFAAKEHAEIQALKKIRYLDADFSKIKVYVYRATKNGKLAMARPCASCLAFMRELGIKNIYYTTNGGYASEELIYDQL